MAVPGNAKRKKPKGLNNYNLSAGNHLGRAHIWLNGALGQKKTVKPNSEQIQEVLFHALGKHDPAEREKYLAEACENQPELREQVESLLRAHEQAGEFLKKTVELEPEFAFERPGMVSGRYKLLEKIGEGGMGVVYMAEQQEPVRRKVALKIIKVGMDTRQVVARFEAERQALALMDHPNIAKVFDAGATAPGDSPLPSDGRGAGGEGSAALPTLHSPLCTHYGRPYFVMELVQGVPITEFCDKNQLSVDQRVKLFVPVCQAIQSAHQKGIIHRDIKPGNILVTLNPDGSGHPMVIDFGVAKAINQKLTEKTLFTNFAAMIGSPAYMSPEQAEMSRLDVDTRADIYSLGVLLYELLTGTTPFPEKRLRDAGYSEMQRIILHEEPERPSTRLSTLQGNQRTVVAGSRVSEVTFGTAFPSDLDWIVMKCLEKDRERRYETANGLARDLERQLRNEPIVARPPSAGYRLCKFVSRNRLAVGAGALVLLVLVLGVLVSTWQAIRASRATSNEAKQKAAAQQELYNSLLAQAHATRLMRQVGYRDRVFDLLQRAKALDIAGKNPTDLRREAAACLGDFVGLVPTTLINFPTNSAPADRTQFLTLSCLDGSGRLAAFSLVDQTILLCDIHSGKQVARLSDANGSVVNLCFNESGDHLSAVYGPKADNWRDFAPKRRVCTWARDANGFWNKSEDRALPGANGLGPLGSQMVVMVVDIDVGNVGSDARKNARFRLFSLTTGGFLPGYDATNSLPGWNSFWIAAIPEARLLALETVDLRNPTSSVVLHLYDWQTGRLLKQLPLTAAGLLNYSDDAKFLAWLSPAGATIYSLPNLDIVHQFKEDFQDGALFLGTVVALPMWQQCRTRLWDLITKEDIAFLDEPEVAAPVDCSSDGSSLLTVGQHRAWLYHLKTPEKLELPAHVGVVPGVGFSPEGSRVASVGRDKVLRVCDTLTGRILWRAADLAGSGQCVCYSPDGKWLATGDYDSDFIRIWDAQSGKESLELGTNNAGLTFSVEFSPDGRWLAAAGEQGVRLWAMQTGLPETGVPELSAKMVKPFPERAMSLTFAPDSRSLAFFSLSNLYIWHLDTSAGPQAVDLGSAASVQSATLPYLWHFDWLSQQHPVASGIVNSVQNTAFTPDGQKILTVGPTGEIMTLDVSSGEQISSFRVGAQTRPRNLALSPDGSVLALASASEPSVDLWNPKTGQLLYSLTEHSGTVSWLAWSPDSRRIAVTRDDGKISIWDLQRVNQILTQAGLNP